MYAENHTIVAWLSDSLSDVRCTYVFRDIAKKDELGEQLILTIPTHLWVASNNLFASIRPYQPPLEAASSTGLHPLKKYPQLGRGMLIMCREQRDSCVVPSFRNSQ